MSCRKGEKARHSRQKEQCLEREKGWNNVSYSKKLYIFAMECGMWRGVNFEVLRQGSILCLAHCAFRVPSSIGCAATGNSNRHGPCFHGTHSPVVKTSINQNLRQMHLKLELRWVLWRRAELIIKRLNFTKQTKEDFPVEVITEFWRMSGISSRDIIGP